MCANTRNPTEIRCNHSAPLWSILGRRKFPKDASGFQWKSEHLCLPQDRTTLADGPPPGNQNTEGWSRKSTWLQAVGDEALMQTKRWHSEVEVLVGPCSAPTGVGAWLHFLWGKATTCPGLLNAREEMVRKGEWVQGEKSMSYHRKSESIVLGFEPGRGG